MKILQILIFSLLIIAKIFGQDTLIDGQLIE